MEVSLETTANIPMIGVSDWRKVRDRYEDFWHRRNRKPLYRIAVTDGGQETDIGSDRAYHDIDWQIASSRRQFARTRFYGEGYPFCKPRTGYAAWGGPVSFRKDTIWIEPSVREWNEDSFTLDPYNDHFQEIIRHLKTLLADSGGEYHVAMPSLLPPLDIMSCKRGAEQLCLDLLTDPFRVKAAQLELIGAFKWMLDTLWSLTPRDNGYSGWYVCWSLIPHYTMQCDFSAMLGPDLFEEFVVPEIVELAGYVGRCIYHLDGPDAVRHLDMLLELPDVQAIQWTPGAGASNKVFDWLPMLQNIQSSGKGLCIQARLDDIDIIRKNLNPEGLFVWVLGDVTDEQARWIVDG